MAKRKKKLSKAELKRIRSEAAKKGAATRKRNAEEAARLAEANAEADKPEPEAPAVQAGDEAEAYAEPTREPGPRELPVKVCETREL